MSKKLRELCGYQSNPLQKTCSNCAAFTFTAELPTWMKEENARNVRVGLTPRYSVEVNGRQKLLRCADHKFAVTKTARCDDWRQKED